MPDEKLAPAWRCRSRSSELGTEPQERDLLRMLLQYGHEPIVVPMQDEEGNTEDVETSVASASSRCWPRTTSSWTRNCCRPCTWTTAGATTWARRWTAAPTPGMKRPPGATWIDLLSERHALSPNWRRSTRIYTTREREVLLDAIEEAIILLKERRVDRSILERQDELKEAGNEEDQLLVLQQHREAEPGEAGVRQSAPAAWWSADAGCWQVTGARVATRPSTKGRG